MKFVLQTAFLSCFVWITVNALVSVANTTNRPTQDLPDEVVITQFGDSDGPFVCSKRNRVWVSRQLQLPEGDSPEIELTANMQCIGVGEFEKSDFVTISYQIDKGGWKPLVKLKDDFQRSTFHASFARRGNRVRLKIEAQTSASNEIYLVHRLGLMALANDEASFPPDHSIDLNAGIQTSQGTLIVDGGKMERVPGHPTVEAFKKLVGGIDQPIVVSPTASREVTDEEWKEYSDAWKNTIGFKRVSFMHSEGHDRNESNTDAFVQDLRNARGLFMRGGRQWRLVDAYGNADEPTKTLKEMRRLLERGGVIAGTSAGATIQGDFLPRGYVGGSGRMVSDLAKHRKGFDFLPNVAFDVHVSQRTRTTDLHEVLAYAEKRGQNLLGIGIDENTAIVVQGKVFTVIGLGNVFVHTVGQSETGNDILILDPGDRYNLSTRKKFVPTKR